MVNLVGMQDQSGDLILPSIHRMGCLFPDAPTAIYFRSLRRRYLHTSQDELYESHIPTLYESTDFHKTYVHGKVHVFGNTAKLKHSKFQILISKLISKQNIIKTPQSCFVLCNFIGERDENLLNHITQSLHSSVFLRKEVFFLSCSSQPVLTLEALRLLFLEQGNFNIDVGTYTYLCTHLLSKLT